jgi:hypothetical protein
LTELSEGERGLALARYRLIRSFFEGEESLSAVARYRKDGLVGITA